MSSSIGPFSLGKSERVKRRRDIDLLFSDSSSLLAYPIRCTFRIGADAQQPARISRLMVTAPKRNHKHAVVRNLLKRRMREAYRLHKTLLDVLPSGVDLSLSYIGKDIVEYTVIERAVVKILTQIEALCRPA